MRFLVPSAPLARLVLPVYRKSVIALSALRPLPHPPQPKIRRILAAGAGALRGAGIGGGQLSSSVQKRWDAAPLASEPLHISVKCLPRASMASIGARAMSGGGEEADEGWTPLHNHAADGNEEGKT